MKRIIAIISILAFLIIYSIASQVTELSVIEYDGYAVENNNIVQNLISENITISEARIKPVKFSAYDTVYKQYNNIYIGEEEKIKINETIPLYVNNNLTIINMSDNTTLIDETFEHYEGYNNFLLSEGILYNRGDNERADYNDYYFLVLSSGMHVNSQIITLKTSIREIEIPLNSIINFEEDKVKYYVLENDTFVYYRADDIDDNTTVKIKDKEYNYIDLLKNLNIYEEELPEAYDPTIDNSENLEENQGSGNNQVIYQKPTVECDTLVGNVYSAATNLRILDPAGRIKKAVTFEVLKDGNLFLRKSFINSGTIEINGLEPNTTYKVVGYFTYRNELGNLVESTFYEEKLTTKSKDTLPEYEFSFNNGSVYAKKIEIANFKMISEINSELIKGTKRIAIKIGDDEYNLSNNEMTSLFKGEEILYETPETLKSNSNIEYEIVVYDLFGQELKILNNKGFTKTSKIPPTASITSLEKTVNSVEVEIKLNNEDEVNISNYRYIIEEPSGVIVEQGNIEEEIFDLTGLSQDQKYLVYVYGDYDLNDGNGSMKNQLIASGPVYTEPLNKLGYIRMDVQNSEVSEDSVTLKMKINKDTTHKTLVDLLEKMNITLTSENEELYFTLTDEQIEKIKNGEEIEFVANNLTSATEYNIALTSIVRQGTKTYAIQTLSAITSFKTLKKEAIVLIKNAFTTENLIDFDVKIEDIDGTIESDRVILEVRNAKNQILNSIYLNINDDYKRLTFDKLEPYQKYTFVYIAEEYNLGEKNATFEQNKELYKHTIVTEEGISGNIGLTTLLKEQGGKNLFDINNLQNWKGNGQSSGSKTYSFTNNTVILTGKNGWYNYSYYLPEYKSKQITVSFKARYRNNEDNNKAAAYLSNSDSSTKTYQLSNLSNEYKEYSYTLTLNSKGYIGFLIYETSGKGLSTTIEIKDLQIEVGNKATSYEEFKKTDTYLGNTLVSLNDSRDEIPTDDYYVKVYKEDVLTNTYKYSMENNNINHEHSYTFLENSNYRLDLVVKIKEREYVIATTGFTTEKEIRSIKTTTDFFNMHSNGKYVVLNDLDFRSKNQYYGTFSGEIDFQGHTVYVNKTGRPAYLINTINTTGVIKNLDLKVSLDNKTEISSFYGLAYYNHGLVENIMVTLTSSTDVPNTNVSLIVRDNYGSIENFVVNSEAVLHGIKELSYMSVYNYGTIKNGYLYGEGIDASYSNPTTGNKRVGAVAGYTSQSSIIENIYSLVEVNATLETAYDKQVGNLVGENARGIIRNSYSVGTGTGREKTKDPNVGLASTINANNLYYVSDEIYNSNYSVKVSKLALRDSRFQINVINKDEKFNIEENLEKGYYPQIIWPDCMPIQASQPLPVVTDADLVDITSLEVLETNGDTAKVIFNINNPSAERIAKIDVKNVTTRIISQTDSKGKTQVVAEITNPIECVSKYYVKKIVSVGEFNISTERTYQDNERVLLFDLYRRIYTIDDFISIKQNPKENYILESDLDFSGRSDYLISSFSGKLNGNNHTISNIAINSGNGLITTLSGTIMNLHVDNYLKKSNTTYGGLVYQANANSVIDNVHMTNVDVKATKRLGALVGYGNGVMIRNSSVSGFTHVTESDTVEDLYVGALAGYLENSYVENSYAQDIKIDVSKARTTYGVGGLVGRLASGTIKNVYAIGSINTSSSHTGGIVGYNAGRISNVYSNVEITSALDYIGGIVGRTDNSYISNTLVLGNIYSSYITSYLHRTAGNSSVNRVNYVWDKQLINGFETENLTGEYFISINDLMNATVFENTIGLGEYFDYSNVDQGYLPKLKGTDEQLLPNQKNNILKEDVSLKIKEIVVNKRVDNATVNLTIHNPSGVIIKSVEFDYLDVTNVNKNGNIDGETIYEVEVKPNRYYDTYKVSKIIYEENGIEKTINKSNRIKMQFYKEIKGFDDWQKIPSDTAENYRLTGDVDFKDKVNINTNVSIGRLEGVDEGYTLRNLDLKVNGSNQSLISELTVSLKNVNFDNIKIINSTTSAVNYNNIIRLSYADIDDVSFSNITLEAKTMGYVGIIGNQRGYNVKNITLDNIFVTGKDFSSGLISRLYNISTNIRNIKINKNNIDDNAVNITGANYVGAVIGHKDYSGTTHIYEVDATNVHVTGSSYVGGLFGYGGGIDISISDSTVTGTGNYVGGIGGNSYTYTSSNSIANNVTVTGKGQYIGGLYGSSYVVNDSFVIDSDIKSNTTNQETSVYIGGVIGTSGYTFNRVGVIRSNIISNGNYAGGIIGRNSGVVTDCYVTDTTISAPNYAGGISGYTNSGSVVDSYVNARITVTNLGAGGISGYVYNTGTTNSIQVSKIVRSNVFNSTITAYTNAGGLIGYATADLYKNIAENIYHFRNDFVVADIYTTNPNGNATMAVGNNIQYTQSVNNLKVYNNSTINNIAIVEIEVNGLKENNLVTAADLALKSTYTNLNFDTKNWNFSKLELGYYPFVRNGSSVDVPNQIEIPLPVATFARRLLSMTHDLPTFEVYASDIDKINIEFNKVDSNSTFIYKSNNTTSDEISINNRTYTLTYDYEHPIEITITNGINTSKKTIKVEDVRRKVSTYKNNYYYIKNNILNSNIDLLDNKFIHVFEKYGLDEFGNIYDLETSQVLRVVEPIQIIEAKPLYEFNYNDYKIKTFNNYSVIMGEEEVTNDLVLLVKNNNLFTIDGNLNSIHLNTIVDCHNDKEIQTILDTDGSLYNLQDKIKVPDNFKNTDIKAVSNNVNSTNNIVLIEYNNGSVIGFNYLTGEVVFEDKAETDVSLFSYLRSNFSLFRGLNQNDEVYNSYQESLDLEQKLIEKPIETLINNITNNGNTNKTYTTKYDAIQNRHLVYKEEDVLTKNQDEIKSQTTIIDSNAKLIDFYFGSVKSDKYLNKGNNLKIFIVIGIGIIISLILWVVNIKFIQPRRKES